jgi:hypothetical protein
LCHPIRNEIPLRPFAKGGWGDFDAETSVESNAGVQPFSRENGEVVFRCRPLTGNGKIASSALSAPLR